MMREFWTKLDVRQRYIVGGGLIFVIVALLLELIIFPHWDARARLKKTTQSQSKKLAQMVKIDADLAASDAKIAGIKNMMASRRTDFTLFAYLEKKAALANVQGRIKQMNSIQGVRFSSFEETLVDLKLEKITIGQLADFLYQIESTAEMIKIKRITINKMKESPEYISVQLLISTYAPLAPSFGG
jgi:type II secretory pathway component PulM